MTTLKYAILDNDDSTAFLLSCILERIGQFSIEIFSSPKRLLNSVKLKKPGGCKNKCVTVHFC